MIDPVLTTPATAQRASKPKWRDVRLLVGFFLIIASMAMGARWAAAADATEPVWALTQDLAAGSQLEAGDLVEVGVVLPIGHDDYAPATEPPPVGSTLTRDVTAGELLPTGAISTVDGKQVTRLVTVPVERFHAPADVARGDRVDVYATPRSDSGGGAVALVLPGALVHAVESGGARFGATGDVEGVVLAVPVEFVERVVGAARRGSIDLVRVPEGVR